MGKTQGWDQGILSLNLQSKNNLYPQKGAKKPMYRSKTSEYLWDSLLVESEVSMFIVV